MKRKSFEEIYEEIYAEIYPRVNLQERGLLYKIIQELVEADPPHTQEKTKQICESFGIKSNSYQKDDMEIVLDFVYFMFVERLFVLQNAPGKETIKSIVIKLLDDEKIKLIVFGACTIVGILLCIKYLEVKRSREEDQSLNQKKGIDSNQVSLVELPRSVVSNPIPAALCLIVPAKAASSNLVSNSPLDIYTVTNLIDNASYFVCDSFKQADEKERNLELTNEQLVSDSQKEVYVRIHISDGGRNLIGKSIPYVLKSNLLSNAQYVVKQCACLKNLSGLEAFNRV